jgi:2-succinyl-6-hydroxy-2,4-cyclohexadiene-1-carboxylate synthase
MPTDNNAYQVVRRGTGDPLLVLHGFTGSARNWQTLMTQLQDDYRLIAPDIIGHGQSAKPADIQRYQIEHVAAEIMALVTEPVHLLGYSMGGRLALTIAVHHPDKVRSLILESAAPGLQTSTERDARRTWDYALADRIEREGIRAFVDYWETLALWDSQRQLEPAVRDRLRQQRLQNSPRGLANSLRGMGTGVMPPLWDALPHLTLPVRLLVGEYDEKYVALNQRMAQVIPRSDLIVVAGAGHTVHLERPDDYAKLVRQLLQTIQPS